MTEDYKKLVAEMYDNGLNPEDIAEELGLDDTEVMDYCAGILQQS